MLNSISNLWLDAVATIILSLAWSFQVMVCVCRIKKSQWWLFPFILSKIFNRSRCGSQCLMNCYHLHFLFQWLTQIGLVAFRFSLLRLESSPSQALIESLFSFCRVEKLDILPSAGSRKGLSEVFRPDNPQSLLAGAAGGIFPKPYTTACHDNFWFDLECTSFLTQPSGAYWKKPFSDWNFWPKLKFVLWTTLLIYLYIPLEDSCKIDWEVVWCVILEFQWAMKRQKVVGKGLKLCTFERIQNRLRNRFQKNERNGVLRRGTVLLFSYHQ